MNNKSKIIHTILVILFIYGCNQSFKPIPWQGLEKKFEENHQSYFMFTEWLESNYEITQTTFVRIDSLPYDKIQATKSLGIINILFMDNECSESSSEPRITYQVNWVDKKEGIFLYVINASCLSQEIKENIKTNGAYKAVQNDWYLVQKNYDWFFE